MIYELERLIEQAVEAGAHLDEIEKEIITPAPVDEEQKAVLWLFAEPLHARHSESIGDQLLPVG
jgi:hypothetical protein